MSILETPVQIGDVIAVGGGLALGVALGPFAALAIGSGVLVLCGIGLIAKALTDTPAEDRPADPAAAP